MCSEEWGQFEYPVVRWISCSAPIGWLRYDSKVTQFDPSYDC